MNIKPFAVEEWMNAYEDGARILKRSCTGLEWGCPHSGADSKSGDIIYRHREELVVLKVIYEFLVYIYKRSVPSGAYCHLCRDCHTSY